MLSLLPINSPFSPHTHSSRYIPHSPSLLRPFLLFNLFTPLAAQMFIRCAVMQRRFSAALSTLYTNLRASQFGFIAERFALALFISVFALGGATIGAIAGAIKGNTTETGLLRGFSVGAVGGAITGVQLMELITNGE